MSQVLQVRELNLDELYDVKKLPSSAKFFQWCLKIVEKELASNLGKLTFSLLKNQTFQFCFLFSSLLAWRGEMLYAVRMQSVFFGTRKTLRTLLFVSKTLRSNVWTHVGQCNVQTCPNLCYPDQTMDKKTEKKKNKKQKWDVDFGYMKRWS